MEPTGNHYTEEYLILTHKACYSHKDTILSSSLCGCFYCKQTFYPTEIEDWIDEQMGESALCPKCGIDSVIDDRFPITNERFLEEMNRYFF